MTEFFKLFRTNYRNVSAKRKTQPQLSFLLERDYWRIWHVVSEFRNSYSVPWFCPQST